MTSTNFRIGAVLTLFVVVLAALYLGLSKEAILGGAVVATLIAGELGLRTPVPARTSKPPPSKDEGRVVKLDE